ncbi:MAG TPA: TlpA disulfide reductase family protein [Planctomycetota bacterium]|nr:TlpA disulfide reductase family protein [Planctomycetota bacterium]
MRRFTGGVITPRRLLTPAIAAALLASASATARADLLVGEPAPGVVPTAVVREPAPTPQALLGRVALIEFFSTTCPHCQAEVAHLNGLHRAYGARGLVVVAVSHQGHAAAHEFARDWRVEFGLAVAAADVLRDFDVPSFPRAVLLDPAGHVLWRGHPGRLTNPEVEAALDRGGVKPPVPPSLAWADAGVARGDWAATRDRLEAMVRETVEPTPASRAAHELSAWIGWLLRARRAGAEDAVAAGRPWDAVVALRAIAAAAAGTPAGAEAAERAAALESDPASQAEIEAGRAYAEARARRGTGGDKESLEAFRQVVTRWPGTRGAARAEVFVRDLEKAARGAPRR